MGRGQDGAVKRLLVAALACASSLAVLAPVSSPAEAVQTHGRTDFYYAAAGQGLDAPAAGFQATFTVEKPHQVPARGTHHSLGQIGLGQRADGSQLEAGWIREKKRGLRLFSFWRPSSGADTCYDTCGFHAKGPGKKPGHRLRPGQVLTVGFQHVGNRWWLLVDGKRSGYYKDKLWKGHTFTGADYAQVWGEVTVKHGHSPCIDMGNGTSPLAGPAAQITGVTWIGGPATNLTISPETDTGLYDAVLTSPSSMVYGGPGAC